VVSGSLNKQIATELNISEFTVKIHRGHVMRKMHAGSLADLVRMAEHLGAGVRKTAVSRILCKHSRGLMFRAGYTGYTRAEGKALRRRNLSAGSGAGIRRDRAQLVPASSNPGRKA
jgi:Bacterial regulatory proteins, luxR family